MNTSFLPKAAESLSTSVPGETPSQLADRMAAGKINIGKFLNTAVGYPWKSTGFPSFVVRGAAQMLKGKYEANKSNLDPYLESLRKMPKEKIESVINANPDAFRGVSNQTTSFIPRIS